MILKKQTNIDESEQTDLRARSQNGVSAICGLVGGHIIYCCCSLCISYVSLGKGGREDRQSENHTTIQHNNQQLISNDIKESNILSAGISLCLCTSYISIDPQE